jgi:hypothetical protein
MRALFFSALLLISGVASFAQDDVYGFTNGQLQSALRQSGVASQRLYSIQTFGAEDNGDPAYLTVLSSSRSGWHVSILHRIRGGFNVEWSSGRLPAEFEMSSPGNFSIYDIGEESTVMFSGCAQHRCGGDYHGFLLYSTVRKEAFFALLSQQEDQPRKVTFSNNALEPKNKSYMDALQKAANEVIHMTDPN